MLYVNRKMSKTDLIEMVRGKRKFSEIEKSEALAALKKWHSASNGELNYYNDSDPYIVEMMLKFAALPKIVKFRVGCADYSWKLYKFQEKNHRASVDDIIAEIDRIDGWTGNLQEWGKFHGQFERDSAEGIYWNIVASIAAVTAISKGKWKVDSETAASIPMLLKAVLDLYENDHGQKISEDEVREWMSECNRKLADEQNIKLQCKRYFCLSLDKEIDLTNPSDCETKIHRDAVARMLYKTRLQLESYGCRTSYERYATKIDTNDVVEACLILADKAMEAIAATMVPVE